jgi:hypothetical protein
MLMDIGGCRPYLSTRASQAVRQVRVLQRGKADLRKMQNNFPQTRGRLFRISKGLIP